MANLQDIRGALGVAELAEHLAAQLLRRASESSAGTLFVFSPLQCGLYHSPAYSQSLKNVALKL